MDHINICEIHGWLLQENLIKKLMEFGVVSKEGIVDIASDELFLINFMWQIFFWPKLFFIFGGFFEIAFCWLQGRRHNWLKVSGLKLVVRVLQRILDLV